jgi:hypothetical protein
MTPAGHEPNFSADDRPQTHALDHAASPYGVTVDKCAVCTEIWDGAT